MTKNPTVASRLVVLMLAVAGLVPAAPASSQTTPGYFPASAVLDATAYTLRVAGADRYATAATIARIAAVNSGTSGGYPFDEADRNEPAKGYGLAACPRLVGVAAGDTGADALAAAPLKDLPGLELGDEVVDSTAATLLITESTRSGASGLSGEVIDALGSLHDANCVFDAVVFGGPASVPATAEATLDEFADRVVRIGGVDRFATAAAIAASVADAAGLPDVALHQSADDASSAPNAVVLAEALTGADALAVGPVAAAQNVPVLLAFGDELPAPTRDALAALKPDTLLVLGGRAALSDAAVVAAAAAAGGADIVRLAGATRYETAVRIAQRLGGIFATEDDDATSNLVLGFARSDGSGATHRGFSDALAAAWFLDTFSDVGTAPRRPPPPIEQGGLAAALIGGEVAGARAPLLLVEPTAVPAGVSHYLQTLWPDSAGIATPFSPSAPNAGGFGFVFGGIGAISDAAHHQIAELLSGGTYRGAATTDLAPTLDTTKVFFTSADLSAVTGWTGGGVTPYGAIEAGPKLCAARGAFAGVRWWTLYDAADAEAILLGEQPAAYENGRVGAFPAGQSRYLCLGAEVAPRGAALGLSLSGHATAATSLSWGTPTDSLVATSRSGRDNEADEVSGADMSEEVLGGEAPTRAVHVYRGVISLTVGDRIYNRASFELHLELTRTDAGQSSEDGGPDSLTFNSTLRVSGSGDLDTTLKISGEGATTSAPLRLFGQYDTDGRRGVVLTTLSAGDASASLTGLVLDGHL